MTSVLELGLSGPDLPALFAAAAATDLVGSGPPVTLTVNSQTRKVNGDWATAHMSKAKDMLMAKWDGGKIMIALQARRIVKVRHTGYTIDPGSVATLLSGLPCTLGSTGGLYPEWEDGSLGERYSGPGFSDLHHAHGWACIFRGEGHNRLVSRRWLEYGPWKLHRAPNDTTLVQFHQLGVDADTALSQARIGHERMGISDSGGFIQSDYVYATDLRGLYDKTRRELHVAIHGREVSQREMLDACAARLYQRLGPDQPLDNIVYVFMEKDAAIAHLHELWLRGLGCHAIIDGDEVDLTADYRPVPTPIEWTQRA